MRKLMTRGLLAGAVALGGIAVAGAASADTRTATEEKAVDRSEGELIEEFRTLPECDRHGRLGLELGKWRAFECTRMPSDTWGLWVDH